MGYYRRRRKNGGIGADKGSGGLWNNSKDTPGKDPSTTNGQAPFGEWNSFRIIMVGTKVTVFMNGEKVVDDSEMENYFDRSIPIFEKGPIQLQTHGGEIRWRNVFIRGDLLTRCMKRLANPDSEKNEAKVKHGALKAEGKSLRHDSGGKKYESKRRRTSSPKRRDQIYLH